MTLRNPPPITDLLSTPYVPGYYYGPTSGVPGSTLLSAGLMRTALVVPGRSCVLTEIGLEVTVVGSAGALIRLGIYTVNDSSAVMDLLADCGTFDATVLGYTGITISQPVTAGRKLMLVAAIQGAPATGPTVRTNSTFGGYLGNTTAATISGTVIAGSSASGITGALPSTHTLSGSSTSLRILTKAAA